MLLHLHMFSTCTLDSAGSLCYCDPARRIMRQAMVYESFLDGVNEGRWPRILYHLNNDKDGSFYDHVFRDLPDTRNTNECVAVRMMSEGNSMRMSTRRIDLGGIYPRVSLRVLAYLRDTGELRQFPLTPTCGNPACINPKHQYVYGISTPPGRSDPTPEKRAASESRTLIRKMVQAAMQSGGSEVVIPVTVAAQALGVSQ